MMRAVTLTVLFSVYYLLYLTDFHNGSASDTPYFIPLIKYGAYAALLLLFAPYKLPAKWELRHALAGLFLLFGLSYLAYSGGDPLFLNSLAFVPLLFSQRFKEPLEIFSIVKNVVVIQCALSFYLRYKQVALWDHGVSSGGVGNPSSFGFLCCAAYLYVHSFSNWKLAQKAVLVVGCLVTNSVFAIGAIAALVFCTEKWRSLALILSLSAIGLASLYFYEQGSLTFVIHKFRAVLGFIGLGSYSKEAGITATRLIQHATLIQGFIAEPWTAIFGHINSLPYYGADGQYLSYLGSFGIPLTAAFVYLNISIYREAQKSAESRYYGHILLLFMAIFCFNRILDYFPIALLYFAAVSGLSRSLVVVHELDFSDPLPVLQDALVNDGHP